MWRRGPLAALVAGSLLVAAGNARAVDGMSVEVGSGDSTDMARVGLQRDWKVRWFEGQSWHLGGYWDLALGYWHSKNSLAGTNTDLVDIGLTPVFRLQQNDGKGPYVEAGIGFHLLSHTSIGTKRFSTAFQFGDQVGAGFRFGAKGEYDLGYRFQHLSNGSIKQPNNGINFNQVRFQYHF